MCIESAHLYAIEQKNVLSRVCPLVTAQIVLLRVYSKHSPVLGLLLCQVRVHTAAVRLRDLHYTSCVVMHSII